MTNRPSLVVFDCDGTLVDSHQTIISCVQNAFALCGLDVPPAAAVRDRVGLSLADFVQGLAPSTDAATRERLIATYREEFARSRGERGADPLFPGIGDLLADLAGAGILLGVATGKSRRGLDRVLDEHGLRSWFVTLQTADDAPGKPHPAMVLQAMEEAGVKAHETVMVGDSTVDVQAARNAGARAIGVSWGAHAPALLRAAGAPEVVDDVAALARCLGLAAR